MDEQSESTIGSSPVTVFLTRNCSVRDTEIPMGQIERQQKVLDLTKLKSLLWQDSQFFFSVLTLSREGKNVALIKEINCKQVLIWFILVCVYPFSCIC